MPRRIPDFPDAFGFWNSISSVGSIITLLSTLFFFYVIYSTLTSNLRSSFNSWKSYTNYIF
jgi:cytochrome c oxidase subunit 1